MVHLPTSQSRKALKGIWECTFPDHIKENLVLPSPCQWNGAGNKGLPSVDAATAPQVLSTHAMDVLNAILNRPTPSGQSSGVDGFICAFEVTVSSQMTLASVSFPSINGFQRPTLQVLSRHSPHLPGLPQHWKYYEPVFISCKPKLHNLDTILHSSKRTKFPDILDENTALAKKTNIGNRGERA